MLRHNTPGAASCNVLPAALLNIEGKPGRAFGLLAIKGVGEVPATLGVSPTAKSSTH
jgi:hypothetical protein